MTRREAIDLLQRLRDRIDDPARGDREKVGLTRLVIIQMTHQLKKRSTESITLGTAVRRAIRLRKEFALRGRTRPQWHDPNAPGYIPPPADF